MKKIILTLLTIFALTFPGMSVCATELQTDPADAGDAEEAISQEVLDQFSNDEIYYYNPEYDSEASSAVTILEMYELIESQKLQIQTMEDVIQAKDNQIAMMQKGMDHLGLAVKASVILIIGLIIYAVYLWRVTHDKGNSNIVDFRRHAN